MNTYAIVEKNSKRAIAIVDSSLVEWFKQIFPIFDVIEINSIGSSTINVMKE